MVWLGRVVATQRVLPVDVEQETQSPRGGALMADTNREIVFDNVTKFYGEVLGVNRVSLCIPPGITSLVGPNGSGKTTLMNVMTGLILPAEGTLTVCGHTPDQPEEFFRTVGYCSQF